AQRARAILLADIASAGFDPRATDLGRTAITPLTTASNDSITIQGDFNMSGTVGDETSSQSPETITYLYDASSGRVTRNGKVFLSNIVSFSFTYYDKNGSSSTAVPGGSITSLSSIQQVRVKWSQTGAGSDTLQTELKVNLRNYRGS